MAWQPIFSLGSTGPTGSVLYTNGNGKTVSSNSFIVNETSLLLGKDFVPQSDAVYNLGATGYRWGELFIGRGTINIAGPSGLSANGVIGTDDNSIVYTQRGFATPFINIGPSEDVLLEPGLIGGWRVGPTGTIGQAGYDLVAQAIHPTGGATGPVYSLINRAEPQEIPSAFQGTPSDTAPLSVASTGPTGATVIGSCYITTSVTGYIWVTASSEFTSSDESKTTDVAMYIKINNTSFNPTVSSIPPATGKKTGSPAFANINVNQRTTTKFAPGGYTGTVYAYTTDDSSSISNTHCDVFALGNLS